MNNKIIRTFISQLHFALITFLCVDVFLFSLFEKAIAQPKEKNTLSYNIYNGDTINRKDKQGRKQGPYYKFYKTDTVFYKGQFVNDKPQGTFTYYSEKGKLESTLVWDATGTKATAKHYYDTGKLRAKGNYINQKKDSTWIYYNADDSLASIENYKLGLRNGDFKVYYKTGGLARHEIYVADKLNGPGREFFDDGKKKIECTYKNGNLDGYYKLYYPTGFVHIEGPYKNGKRNGTWKLHKEDGTVIATDIFIDGKCKENNIEKAILD